MGDNRRVNLGAIATAPPEEPEEPVQLPPCDAGVTQLNGIGRKLGLRLLDNRLAHENGKRANHTPLQAKLPERCTETLDPSLSGKNDATFA